MFTKSLATMAIAASLLVTNTGVALAKNSEMEHGFPEKESSAKEMHQLKRAERKAPLTTQCVFNALDKRDVSTITALDAYNAGVRTALTARKTAITAALALTDETAKKDALKKAGEAYRTAVKKQKDDLKAARKALVTTMSTELKTCGESNTNVRSRARSEIEL
ncbi:MAG: hypothetical protein WC101_04815 [Candidatus Gracilibacteria bacterium]